MIDDIISALRNIVTGTATGDNCFGLFVSGGVRAVTFGTNLCNIFEEVGVSTGDDAICGKANIDEGIWHRNAKFPEGVECGFDFVVENGNGGILYSFIYCIGA